MKTSFKIIEHPIKKPLVVKDGSAGAVVEFEGVVRGTEQGQKIEGIYYEAYEPMALKVIKDIADELNRSHPICSVEWIHRIGWVPAGEASLWMRIASVHRHEAFVFCEEMIVRMKEDVPIWKVRTTP